MKKEQYLLSQIQPIVDKENKRRKSKGEDFNIFLITHKTSNEQFTHSAFIAELLNPKGSHHKGDIFLKKFVEIISKNIPDENQPKRVETIFNEYSPDNKLEETKVSKEKNIGSVYIDKSNKGKSTGGYIDILLELNGYSIAIENKIYANLQEKQIERYKNYNTDKNIVFYLTLNPSLAKEKGVIINKDYYCISYYNEIDEWLNKCYSLSEEYPILRESIKQYQLLIQKLSGKMESSKDVQNKILNNLEAANSLYKNFNGALNRIKDDFRNSILKSLGGELKEEFEAPQAFNLIEDKNARIYIKHNKNNAKVYFGIECFNGGGTGDGKLYGGIYVVDGKQEIAESIIKDINKEDIKSLELTNRWWPIRKCIYDESLTDTSTLISLHTNENKRKEAIKRITNEMINFINSYKHFVLKANKKEKQE